MIDAPLNRTGELRTADELTCLTGARVTPGKIKVKVEGGAYIRQRKTKPLQWRLYRETKP